MTAAILSSLIDSKHCVSNVVILMLKVIAQCKMGSFLTFINTLVQHKKVETLTQAQSTILASQQCGIQVQIPDQASFIWGAFVAGLQVIYKLLYNALVALEVFYSYA